MRFPLGIAALGLLLATSLPVAAATFTVDTTVDAVDATPGDGVCAGADGACTLRAAIMEANVLPGVDGVVLPEGTFRLSPTGANEDAAETGDLDILETVTVAGAGTDETLIDGFGADRIFDVIGASALAVANLTLKRGSAQGNEGGAIRAAGPAPLDVTNVRFERNLASGGAAIRHTDGALTVVGCDFSGNISGYTGGAIFKDGSGGLNVSTSSFTGNLGGGPGGAIFFDGPDPVSISDSHFVASTGGGGGAVSVANALGLSIANCNFEDSQSSGNGGAVSYTGPGQAGVAGSTFTGGIAGGGGGALYVDVDGNLEVVGCTFTGNGSGYSGGALSYFSEEGSFALRDSTFEDNGAFGGQGGGFYVNATGPLTLANLLVRGNFADGGGGGGLVYAAEAAAISGVRFLDNVTASSSGGGLYDNTNGPATVLDSTFSGNRAYEGDGGGLYMNGTGPFEVQRSTFAANGVGGTESRGGGLILGATEQSLVLNCTFSGNTTTHQGGGFWAGSDVKLWSSTFSGNYAIAEGGGIFNGSTVRIANTIVAASGGGGNCAGNEFDSGNRNIDSDGTCELDGPSDQSGVDPQLGPLAENGGPSPTHALAVSSPAVDAGNTSICPPVDQRGLVRPADGNGDGNPICDIGAYEYFDQCPGDAQKTDPGACGCGAVDSDDNANGVIDCLVNAELKARIARADDILDDLDGQRSPEESARRAELKGVASGLATYLKDHGGGIVLADPSANPFKLLKKVRKTMKAVLRARGTKLEAARAKADAALVALDQAIAAQ